MTEEERGPGIYALNRANAKLFRVLPRDEQRPHYEVLHVKGDRIEAMDGFIQAEQPLPKNHELPDGAVIDREAERCIRWVRQASTGEKDDYGHIVKPQDEGHLWPDLVHTAEEWKPKEYPDIDKACLLESFLGKPAAQVVLDGKRLRQLLEVLNATSQPTSLILIIHVNDQGHPILPVVIERCDGQGKGMIMPMSWRLLNKEEGKWPG